jgi:hypothetical protein
MILRILCPTGHVLDVDAQLAGRKIRCGACGKTMLVPGPIGGPLKPERPSARRPAQTPGKPPEQTKPTAPSGPAARPQTAAPPITQPVAPPTAPPLTPPRRQTAPPQLEIEADLAAAAARTQNDDQPKRPPAGPPEPPDTNLPPPTDDEENGEPIGDALANPVNGRGLASWLRKLWPGARRLPPGATAPDVTEPGKDEQRASLQMAAVTSLAAVLGSLPVVAMNHANLFAAPRWALAAVFLTVLQLVYAAWVINVPDWASARVLMVVCALVTTVYGMLMTLTMITPGAQPLLGLGEARRAAPAWCGLMLVLTAAATWYCGRTSARWKARLPLTRSDSDVSGLG